MHKPNLKCEYSINSRLYTHGDLRLKGVAIAEALQVFDMGSKPCNAKTRNAAQIDMSNTVNQRFVSQ